MELSLRGTAVSIKIGSKSINFHEKIELIRARGKSQKHAVELESNILNREHRSNSTIAKMGEGV